jgi:hypothetical protein
MFFAAALATILVMGRLLIGYSCPDTLTLAHAAGENLTYISKTCYGGHVKRRCGITT